MSEVETATEAKVDKSIIGAKYRKDRQPDWLGQLISSRFALEREVKKSSKDAEGVVTETIEKRPDGIDVDGLFGLARENLPEAKVANFEKQRDSHGFAGRFRMTVRNMLQATTKARHGLFVKGEWTPAPAEWLTEKGAPAAPTHTPQGEKIVVAKEAPAATPEATEATA